MINLDQWVWMLLEIKLAVWNFESIQSFDIGFLCSTIRGSLKVNFNKHIVKLCEGLWNCVKNVSIQNINMSQMDKHNLTDASLSDVRSRIILHNWRPTFYTTYSISEFVDQCIFNESSSEHFLKRIRIFLVFNFSVTTCFSFVTVQYWLRFSNHWLLHIWL